MAGPSKTAPLEAFLTNVDERSSVAKVEFDRQPKEEDPTGAAGRLVILTLLSQSSGPVDENELQSKSELGPDWYERTIRDLEANQFIQRTGPGFSLTDAGRTEAEIVRSRLLSL